MGLIEYLTILTIPIVGGVGVFGVRLMDQYTRDRKRRTYRLSFPSDMDSARVTAWLGAINGTLKSGNRLTGVPSVVFEVWATNAGLTHRLKVPWQHADFVTGQLRAQVPGVRVEAEEDFPRRRWVRAVELGLSDPGRTLRMPVPADTAVSLLTAMQPLEEGETVVVQWVVHPATPRPLPVQERQPSQRPGLGRLLLGSTATRDEVNDRRDKLGEPTVGAVMRVAAVAGTVTHAEHLIRRVVQAVASTRTGSTKFVRRMVTMKSLQERIEAGRTPVAFPMLLTTTELTGLVGWPVGTPFVPGLPRALGKQFPPSGAVPTEGIVLGRSTFSGQERQVAVAFNEALMHTHVLGTTGCLHPDTPIFDPVTETTRTVKQRHEDGVPFHVYAMHGSTLVVAPAAPPVAYQRVDMFELYSDDHRVTVTGQHRVFDGRTFVEVEQLYRRQQSGGPALQLPAISASGLSRLHEDAQRLSRTVGDSRYDCLPYLRSHGRRPQSASGSGQGAAPSPDDAHGPCSGGSCADGSARTQGSSRPGLEDDHPSTLCSSRLSSHAPVPAVQPHLDTFGSTSASRPCASESEVHSCLSCTGGCTRQSVPESKASPSSNLLFNSYFKNSNFWVQPASAETYYDFHVPGYENYLATGLIHHNSGKSVLLGHMARQIMSAGHGLILIETEGNLYSSVLDLVPRERIPDVVLLDVADEAMPVGFNVLDQGHRASAIDELLNLLEHRYGKDSLGVWAQEYLYHGLRTVAEVPGLSFVDVVTLLRPQTDEEEDWQAEVVRGLKDVDLKRWWERHLQRDAKSQQQRVEPVLSRLWQLHSRPELKQVFGQSVSSFQVSDVLKDNRILLVNLKGVSRDTASLAGTLLMNTVWQQAKTVQKTAPTFVMLDEFADFMDLPIGTEAMLAQARKHKLGLVLANQHMAQLKPGVRDAVISNARNKVIFSSNADDGRALSAELGPLVDVSDLTQLQAYEAITSVVTPLGTSGPISISTKPPLKGTGVSGYVRAASREKYGRPAAEVRAAIAARYNAKTRAPGKERPRLSGGEAWG